MSQQTMLMGSKKQGATLSALRPDDAFSETLIFGVSCKNESEYVKQWPVGATLAGKFFGVKQMDLRPGDEAPQSYIKMETVDGEKFRAYAPAQLVSRVGNLAAGTYLEITYKGKETVTLKNGATRNIHAFDVLAESASH